MTTLAGQARGTGSVDGTRSAARLSYPRGVTVDSAGNVYVADTDNSTIRKISTAGVVTTLAGLAGVEGSADGTGSAAQFSEPQGVAVDSAGNVYVADTGNNTIRKVTPTGVVTTVAGLAQVDNKGYPVGGSADGTGSDARFSYPRGVAVDSVGNIYVADSGNSTIRKATATGVVTTLTGLGNLGNGTGVAVDSAANVYVVDAGEIRKVTPSGLVTKLAIRPPVAIGNPFIHDVGLAVDLAANVYLSYSSISTILKVTPAGVTTVLAGLAGRAGSADGTGTVARFYYPGGVVVDGAGAVYVADTINNTIRKGISANSVPAPILHSASLREPSQFGFGITGLSGSTGYIESSSDFSTWQVVGTYLLDGGTGYFGSPTSPQEPQFYRCQVR